MSGVVEPFFVSILLLIVGAVPIITKRISVSTRQVGGKPVFTIRLTGTRAVQFGWISAACGAVVLVLCLYTFITTDMVLVKSALLPLLTIAVLVITAGVYFVEALREFLVPGQVNTANEQARSDEKPKPDNPAHPPKKL